MSPRGTILCISALLLLGCDRPSASEPPAPAPAVDPDPDPDPDNDEILAAADACPDEPGLPPDGCPLRDRDEDGVLDPDDQCPDEPECINGFADADGCPDTQPEDLASILGIIEALEFTPDRWDIRPQSFPALDHIAEVLTRYPDLRVEISGHIDARGAGSVTLRRREPTRRRAEAVRDYLVTKGVRPAQLSANGYGESMPIASNETAEGRAQNRRVELEVYDPPWAERCAEAP